MSRVRASLPPSGPNARRRCREQNTLPEHSYKNVSHFPARKSRPRNCSYPNKASRECSVRTAAADRVSPLVPHTSRHLRNPARSVQRQSQAAREHVLDYSGSRAETPRRQRRSRGAPAGICHRRSECLPFVVFHLRAGRIPFALHQSVLKRQEILLSPREERFRAQWTLPVARLQGEFEGRTSRAEATNHRPRCHPGSQDQTLAARPRNFLFAGAAHPRETAARCGAAGPDECQVVCPGECLEGRRHPAQARTRTGRALPERCHGLAATPPLSERLLRPPNNCHGRTESSRATTTPPPMPAAMPAPYGKASAPSQDRLRREPGPLARPCVQMTVSRKAFLALRQTQRMERPQRLTQLPR